MDTSRVDGVKAPPHDGTPRSHDGLRVLERLADDLAIFILYYEYLFRFRHPGDHDESRLTEQAAVLEELSAGVGRRPALRGPASESRGHTTGAL